MRLDRRRFHIATIGGLWAAIAAALGLPAATYVFVPPKSRNSDEWIDVGDVAQLPTGRPEEVVFRKNRVDGWKVTSEKATAWVIRKSPQEIVAFSPQCTHLGCAYHYSEQTNEFVCPCHTSAFSLEGEVLTGPAPRPLDRYEVKLEGSRLLLGTVRKSEQA